jgi:hypothetical protein
MFIGLAVLAGACKNGDSSKKDGETYRPKDYAFSILLFPEQSGESPGMNLHFSILDTEKSEKNASFFNKLLYAGDSPDKYRDRLVENYRKMYRDAAVSAGISPGEEGRPSFNWEYKETMKAWNPGGGGLVITRDRESYTGGAHGMSTRQYYVIDAEAPGLLGLEDFFPDPRAPELRRLIYEALRNYDGLAEGRPLSEGVFFEDEPELSGNFFIDEKGLGFHWDPYEIAPYSAGQIEIALPWGKIQPLLKHAATETLVKFGNPLSPGLLK